MNAGTFTIGARTGLREFRLFNGTQVASRRRRIGRTDYLFTRLYRMDGSVVVMGQPVNGDGSASWHRWSISADGRLD